MAYEICVFNSIHLFSLIGVGFIGSLFIPNSFLSGYADFALVISGLYMLFQIIMLVDVFYLWG